MNLSESIRLAFSNIRANKLRSILTMLGIIIGVSSVITITTIGSSLKNTISNTLSSLSGSNLVEAYVSQIYVKSEEGDYYDDYEWQESDYLTYDELMVFKEKFSDKIDLFDVSMSAGEASYSSDTGEAKGSVTGTMTDWTEINKNDLLYGRNITKADLDNKRPVCVVSDLFVKYAFPDEDPIGKKLELTMDDGTINKVYIVGVYELNKKMLGLMDVKVSEKDLSTPIFSTILSVSLIPAVSIILRIIPLILICSSIISLVVPGISVTIAFSFLAKALRREDFPALGFPTITVLIPSLSRIPLLLLLINCSTLLLTSLTTLQSRSL